MHPVYFSFQAESFCNGPETELKCKIGFKEHIKYLHLSYTDCWCLVPFSINISCNSTHKMSLFWLQDHEQSNISVTKKWRSSLRGEGEERGTQQEILTRSTPSQIEFLQQQRLAEWMRLRIGICWHSTGTNGVAWLNVSSEGNEWGQLLSIKTNIRCPEDHRPARNLVLMRCTRTQFCKVAGAWIWPQTIIKRGDNERGHNAKPPHECMEDLTFILRTHRQRCVHLIFPWYERTHWGALQPFKCTVHSCRGLEL